MNALEAWQSRNNEYLGVELELLRVRLARAALPAVQIAVPSTEPAPVRTSETSLVVPKERRGFFWRSTPEVATAVEAPRLLPAAGAVQPADAIDQLKRKLAAASEGEPKPSLLMLGERFGLSEFERNTLLLAASTEIDTSIPSMCALAQASASAYPTFALSMSLFEDPAWEVLSPERPLRHWRLIEINQPGAQPLTASALRADERIVSFIKGLNYLDERLAPLFTPMPEITLADLAASQRALAEEAVARLSSQQGHIGPIALVGRDVESKRRVASALAGALETSLLRMQADLLPAHPGELDLLARLWHRESLLMPIALFIEAQTLDGEGVAQRLSRFVARTGGLVFVSSREELPLGVDRSLTLQVDKPTSVEQRSAWLAALESIAESADAADALARGLAGQFNLNQHDIETIAAEVAAASSSQPLETRLWRASSARTRPAMDRLAEKIDARANWDSIVLPEPETLLLRQIAAQIEARSKVYDDWGFRERMNRGFGVTALFAGESGTGKTMAAEVLANALDLDLYRVDLAAVVSKYIGETEKNLRQVFDAAEDGGAILLFDEADALFGKRSEVKDSHDRYANIEINYLLQRMESYRGLAILATNMKSALDAAFTRRLRFIIKFPFPSKTQRHEMWRLAFPPGTPLGPLDHERLARLNATGGMIHNIALNAAFMAAHAGTPVSMQVVLEAARSEFRKTDRPVSDAEFKYVSPAERRV